MIFCKKKKLNSTHHYWVTETEVNGTIHHNQSVILHIFATWLADTGDRNEPSPHQGKREEHKQHGYHLISSLFMQEHKRDSCFLISYSYVTTGQDEVTTTLESITICCKAWLAPSWPQTAFIQKSMLLYTSILPARCLILQGSKGFFGSMKNAITESLSQKQFRQLEL